MGDRDSTKMRVTTSTTVAVNIQFTVFVVVAVSEASTVQVKLASLLSVTSITTLNLPSGAGKPVPPPTPTPNLTALPNGSPLPTNKIVLPDNPTIRIAVGVSASCSEVISTAQRVYYYAFLDVESFTETDVVVNLASSGSGTSRRSAQPLLMVQDDGSQSLLYSQPRKGSLHLSIETECSIYVACSIVPEYAPANWQERMYQAYVYLQSLYVSASETTTVISPSLTVSTVEYEQVTSVVLEQSTSIIYVPVQIYPRRVFIETAFYCRSAFFGTQVLSCNDVKVAILNSCNDIGIPSEIVTIHSCEQIDTWNAVVHIRLETFSTYTIQYTYAIRDNFVNNYFWQRVQLYQSKCGGGELYTDIVQYSQLVTSTAEYVSAVAPAPVKWVEVVVKRPPVCIVWYEWQIDVEVVEQINVWTCDQISYIVQNTLASSCGLVPTAVEITNCECLSTSTGGSAPSSCNGVQAQSNGLVTYTSSSSSATGVRWHANRISVRVMSSVVESLSVYSTLQSTVQSGSFGQVVASEYTRLETTTSVSTETYISVARAASSPNITVRVTPTKNITSLDFLGRPSELPPLYSLAQPSRLFDLNGTLCVSSCRPAGITAENATTATCCNGNGACINGVCYCVPGFSGLLCEASPTPAASPVPGPANLAAFPSPPAGKAAINVAFQMEGVSVEDFTNATRNALFRDRFVSAVRNITGIQDVNVTQAASANGTIPYALRVPLNVTTTGAVQLLTLPNNTKPVENLMSVLFVFGMVRSVFPPNGTVTAVSVQQLVNTTSTSTSA
jgi:hypothetical protein